MAKINNLFAEKFNKDVKKEVIQENKNLKNNVPKSEKSVYLNDREEYDPARPNDYEEIKL